MIGSGLGHASLAAKDAWGWSLQAPIKWQDFSCASTIDVWPCVRYLHAWLNFSMLHFTIVMNVCCPGGACRAG